MLEQAKEVHDTLDLETNLHLKANVRQEDKPEGKFSTQNAKAEKSPAQYTYSH